MNLKPQPKYKSYAYRLCDEKDCERVAYKMIGKLSFCELHDRKYKVEEETKESHGNASADSIGRTA